MITSALLLIGSCGAHDVTPPEGRADSAVASQARRHVASGSGSVAVDRDNASGSSGVFATYETLTLVDITMTGTFQKKNDQKGISQNIGPAGLANCNVGTTLLKWGTGTAQQTWWPANCLEGVTAHSGFVGLIGPVWAERAPMPVYCDLENRCDYFSGGPIEVSVVPRVGTLSLTCSPADNTYAPFTVGCTVTASLDGRFVTELAVVWTDDLGTTPFVACGLGSPCYLTNRYRSGTVRATAKVNGEARSASAQVQYRCVAGDSVIDASPDRRQHLQDLWAAGGDRDAAGAQIPVNQRHEVTQVGRPAHPYYGPGVWYAMEPGAACSGSMTPHSTAGFDFNHTHPYSAGTAVPSSCGVRGVFASRFSERDIWSAIQIRQAVSGDPVAPGLVRRMFVIDPDSIYYIPLDAVPDNAIRLRIRSGTDTALVFDDHVTSWRGAIRSIPRSQSIPGHGVCSLP